MLSKKGQALVEFIIVMPVLIFTMMGMVDLANVIQNKYALESDLDVIVDLYRDGKSGEINSYIDEKKIEVSYEPNGDLTKVIITKKIKIYTPGLNNVLGKNHEIEVSRSIYE